MHHNVWAYVVSQFLLVNIAQSLSIWKLQKHIQRIAVLTMNPLYQALICCLVKLVLSIRNVMSSLDSFLLDFPPIFASRRLRL